MQLLKWTFLPLSVLRRCLLLLLLPYIHNATSPSLLLYDSFFFKGRKESERQEGMKCVQVEKNVNGCVQNIAFLHVIVVL